MGIQFDNLADLMAHGYDALIDVRSPAEYAFDHIPGAINLPVLDDLERARVGTIYKQDCAFTAKKIGAALVARNAARHLDGPLAGHGGGWRPLVYCWRGGQRSGSFATILRQVGWRAGVLEGGYQSYRRLVSGLFYDQDLIQPLLILEGHTGTAKTELLHLLAARGEQVLDLEGLAAHRGSVFGAVARPQPSQKAFEGALAVALSGFDSARPVWVEAESSKIGERLIPPALWRGMRRAPRLRVTAPLAARAAYLNRVYGDITGDLEGLLAVLGQLIPRQGHGRVEHWQGLARGGELQQLASELMSHHYDPSYGRSGEDRAAPVAELTLGDLAAADLAQAADQLVEIAAGMSD